MRTVQDADTWDFSSSGVLLAQILKNLTLMATTSQFPKLLVYSVVSSKSPTLKCQARTRVLSPIQLLGMWRSNQSSGHSLSLQHDTTLVALQMALNVYNGKQAPYASCHIFELYQEDDG